MVDHVPVVALFNIAQIEFEMLPISAHEIEQATKYDSILSMVDQYSRMDGQAN